MKINWKQKLSSRKFWAAIIGLAVSIVAFTKATPETTERIVALIGAIGVLVMYMLAEGIADNGRTIEK
ncbi:MAG: hypothetical protein PT956_03415 [Firmicutes bacterium]|nr:hypothetical protein [Bacillota bacterium]